MDGDASWRGTRMERDASWRGTEGGERQDREERMVEGDEERRGEERDRIQGDVCDTYMHPSCIYP